MQKKRGKEKLLKNLPLNTRIEFVSNCDFTNGIHVGDVVRLTKLRRANGKYIWEVNGTSYIKEKLIPDTFRIIEKLS